eukprot:Amastigsp_a510916_10.p2 type:complete len:139 gc:universal Amastigsp_a510916_10:1-417(+)
MVHFGFHRKLLGNRDHRGRMFTIRPTRMAGLRAVAFRKQVLPEVWPGQVWLGVVMRQVIGVHQLAALQPEAVLRRGVDRAVGTGRCSSCIFWSRRGTLLHLTAPRVALALLWRDMDTTVRASPGAAGVGKSSGKNGTG